MNPGATDARLTASLWKTLALLLFRHCWWRTPCLGDNCLHSFISGAWLWNLSLCDRLEVIRYPALQNRPWPSRVPGKRVTFEFLLIKAWSHAKLMEKYCCLFDKSIKDNSFSRQDTHLKSAVQRNDAPAGVQHRLSLPFMTCVCSSASVCQSIRERCMCLFTNYAFFWPPIISSPYSTVRHTDCTKALIIFSPPSYMR